MTEEQKRLAELRETYPFVDKMVSDLEQGNKPAVDGDLKVNVQINDGTSIIDFVGSVPTVEACESVLREAMPNYVRHERKAMTYDEIQSHKEFILRVCDLKKDAFASEGEVEVCETVMAAQTEEDILDALMFACDKLGCIQECLENDRGILDLFSHYSQEQLEAHQVFPFGEHHISGSGPAIAYGRAKITAQDSNSIILLEQAIAKVSGSCFVVAYDNSSVELRGRSCARGYDNATIEAVENSGVLSYGDCKIIAYGHAHIDAGGTCKVTARDNAKVTISENASADVYDEADVTKTSYANNCTIRVHGTAKGNISDGYIPADDVARELLKLRVKDYYEKNEAK